MAAVFLQCHLVRLPQVSVAEFATELPRTRLQDAETRPRRPGLDMPFLAF